LALVGLTALIVVGSIAPAEAAAAGAAGGLRVVPRSAVPGLVVELRGHGAGGRRARVTISGHRAEVVARRGNALSVIVPKVAPGVARVQLAEGGRRLSTSLRVARGFSGSAQPVIDRKRVGAASIGPAGGTVGVRGSGGTTYELSLPPGALRSTTKITLTALKRVRGIPLKGGTIGVQFGPDGLQLAKPATLMITLRRPPPRSTIGYVYSGKGRGVTLVRAKRRGKRLTLKTEHFSGAGGGQVTIESFMKFAARLLIGQLTLADVDEFLHQLQIVEAIFGEFCLTDETCAELVRRSGDLLEQRASKFSCGFRDPGEAIALLRDGLLIDGDLQLIGRGSKGRQLERERECITNALVSAAAGPASNEPLARAGIGTLNPSDRFHADLDADGVVVNVEWGIFLAGIAAQQDFGRLQGRIQAAAETGLNKVLTDGTETCDKTLSVGKDLLEKGQKIANAAGLLAAEFAAALENCIPRVFVTPAAVTVEVGKTQAFSARSNEGDTSFDWTAGAGSVDTVGLFTAPENPGQVTVTATVRRIVKGTATVTVVCPTGQVEFEGECRTISVTVSPQNALVAPGEGKQFTATVNNTNNQAVTWSASGGSVSSAGFFTAPQQPGSYTLTATSKEDPGKSGSTTVTVATPGVTVTARVSEVPNMFTRAQVRSDPPQCIDGPQQQAQKSARRQDPNPLGTWTTALDELLLESVAPLVSCQGSSADAEATLFSANAQTVESSEGDLTVGFSATNDHTITMHQTGTLVVPAVQSTAYSFLGFTFSVVAEPVTLSCSTTLSGDSRAGNQFENEDSVFQLRIAEAPGGDEVIKLEDTSPATEITLQPGKYESSIENKTTRARSGSEEISTFTFAAEAECVTVS
jgi:hypothetical protein